MKLFVIIEWKYLWLIEIISNENICDWFECNYLWLFINISNEIICDYFECKYL